MQLFYFRQLLWWSVTKFHLHTPPTRRRRAQKIHATNTEKTGVNCSKKPWERRYSGKRGKVVPKTFSKLKDTQKY
jgi:hypothetical protein